MKARFGGNICGFSCLFCSEETSRIRSFLFPLEKEETVTVLSDIPINVAVQFFRFPSYSPEGRENPCIKLPLPRSIS
jgi:hypothetical protein